MIITEVQGKKTQKMILVTQGQFQAFQTLLDNYRESLEEQLTKIHKRGEYITIKAEERRKQEISLLESQIAQCLEINEKAGEIQI